MNVLFNVDLNFMPIHDILQRIEMKRLSCVVKITLENGNDMSLCMKNGNIVFVSSPKKGYRLGEFLINSGALSELQVSRALTESRNAGMSFTRYLVENSMISARELGEVLGQLVEKILIEVFISKNGNVLVTSPLPEILANEPVRLETGGVILDALRIFDEMNRKGVNMD